jgi:D-tyrosyl-tRNA(Tyr) deacylase
VRVVVQRVSQSRVSVNHSIVSEIGRGLCILLGVGKQDSEANADFLADKVRNLRVFEDAQGKMNRSLIDIGGEALVVSQFTLYGDCGKGNRPSFTEAAPAEQAERLYQRFASRLRDGGVKVATGRFQARMDVSLVNDGPVTLVLESP